MDTSLHEHRDHLVEPRWRHSLRAQAVRVVTGGVGMPGFTKGVPVPDFEARVRRLLTATSELQDSLREDGVAEFQDVANRLRDSVMRPLEALVTRNLGDPLATGYELDLGDVSAEIAHSELDDKLWELAKAATELFVQASDEPELAEATAGLQDVAIRMAHESALSDRLHGLAGLQSDLVRRIRAASDGPYLVTNVSALHDWLGQPMPVRPQMALCRCGGSAIKPFCDGAHSRTGFTDAKDPHRIPDQRDVHVGQTLTVFDNRGICQHAGFCSDRLATVFRPHDEPFVAPSGGRMDEIIRAVRDCPSGALSYAVDGQEAREEVDYHGTRVAGIEVSKDGPYRVIGGIRLLDGQARDAGRDVGASLEHYALCRCGKSQNKPFCSGMHWYAKFGDPVTDPASEPTIFEWAGGLPALTRMTRLFYEKFVPADPLLAPLFASMSADHPQRVAKWFGEVFSGPTCYSEEFGGYPRMLSQHLGKCLTEEQRERWVTLLVQAAREAGLPNDAEFRSAFGAYLEWGSRLAVENSQTTAEPPAHMPMPHWEWQTAAGPPGGRVSASSRQSDGEVQEVLLPSADEPVSFEKHIRGFFRPSDKRAMSFAFDLWSYDDVSRQSEAILERIRAGTMPCDGGWPPDRIDALQRWADTGKAP